MDNHSSRSRDPITDEEAELLRPVIHAWLIEGEVSPDTFKLSSADKKDSNRLSVVQGAKTNPIQAYADRASAIEERCKINDRPYNPPVGVFGLAVREVASVELECKESGSRFPLSVWDDSMNADVPEDHAHIDYNEIPPTNKGAHEYVAKVLLKRAKANGWKFLATEN